MLQAKRGAMQLVACSAPVRASHFDSSRVINRNAWQEGLLPSLQVSTGSTLLNTGQTPTYRRRLEVFVDGKGLGWNGSGFACHRRINCDERPFSDCDRIGAGLTACGRYRVFPNVGCLAVQIERQQSDVRISEAAGRRRPGAAARMPSIVRLGAVSHSGPLERRQRRPGVDERLTTYLFDQKS